MLTLKKNVSARMSAPVFAVLLVYFFASWFMLAPPGAAGEAHAGQLEFDGVPVDITTAANEDLVIAPGSGGNSQIGTATGTNTHATTNNDLHVTGALEVDGVSYFDSATYLGDTSSDTVTVTGYFGSSLIPSVDSTYDLGSASLAWRYLYADIISGYNANLALNPANGYSLTGAVTKSASSGNEVAYDYAATINKAAGNYTGIKLNLTQTAASGPATANFLFDLQLGGVSMFNVDSAGNVTAVGTITGSGAAINGTTSHTFTVNSNNDNALTTLRLGGSGGSNGQVTTVSGNLVIDSNGGTVDINDGTLDLSTQTVDVTLNDAVDSLNFDSDTLSIDAQNNRVGIGTAAPDNQLHVSDPAGNVEIAKFEGTNGASIRIDAQVGANTSTTRNYIADTLSAEAGYSPIAPGQGYFISMSGTRRLTLNSDGYLGLGDTTPVANLVVGSDAGAAVAGAGDAYIQNDLEVDGTLYAASASIAGTSSDTFTIDTDNTSATPTLTFGNGGNPFITTPAGNLNLQPASAVIVRDATAPAPAKATAAGSMFVENAFENTGIAYHYDDITMYDKKSFAVISSTSGNPDYAHSIYISQSDNIMQFKEWDTFKFTNTSASIDLITLTPTAGMALLNEDIVDNAVSDILKIQHSSTNAPQAGIGTGLAYYVEDAGNLQKHGSIDTVLTTVTQGSENADMVFKISEAGVLTELMRLNAASDRVDISGDLNVTGAFSAGSTTFSGTTSDTFTVNSDNTPAVTTTITLGGAGAGSGEISTTVGQLSLRPANNNVMLNAAHLTTSTPNTYNIGATNEHFERIFVNNVGDFANPTALYLDSSDLKFNDSVHGDARFFFNLSSGAQNYVRIYDSTVGDYNNSGQLAFYHDGVNGGFISTDKNGTGIAGDLILLPNTGLVGLITTSPTYNFGIDGTAARTMGVERNTTADTAGSNLTINAGGATSGSTNRNGGALYLASGVSTGTGSSSIIMQTAKAGAGGDNAVATRVTIDGTGATMSPHGTAAGNTLELRFAELAAGGSSYVGFKAPDALAGNVIWTLPDADGSPNQVLYTDGAGILDWKDADSASTTSTTFTIHSGGPGIAILDTTGLTGSRTYTFPDATSQFLTTNMPADTAVTLGGGVNALNFDSNTLSIDANNNRIGIGSAAPSQALHVVSSATNTAAALFIGGSTLASHGFDGQIFLSADPSYRGVISYLFSPGDLYIDNTYNSDSGDIFMRTKTAGTAINALTVIGNGYVGLNDTSPVAQLVVGSDAGASVSGAGSVYIQNNLEVDGTLYAAASGLTGTTNDTFEVNSDGNSVTVSSAGQTADHVFTFPDATSAVLTTNMPADTAVTLGGGVDALNFDANTLSVDAQNDRIGIGKANPDHKLDVEGNIRITNSASHANLILSGAGDAFKYSAVNLYNEAGDKLWSIHHRKAAAELNNFLIEEYDGVDYYQRVSVAPGGNMAVGTTDFDGTPAAGRLIVKGTTNDGTTNAQVWRDSDEANVAYLDTNGNLTLSGTISASGSAFSGTTSDTFTVNSDGTAVVSTLALGAAGTTGGSITTGAGNLTIDSTGGTIDINDGIIDLSTQTVDVTLNATADALDFDNGTLSIDASANNVGIGTATPLSPAGFQSILQIEGQFPGLVLNSTNTGGKKFTVGSNTTGVAGGGLFEVYDETALAHRFAINTDGDTGVGTIDFDGTPAIGRLIVKGTTNDGTTNAQVWRDSDEANVAYLDTNGNLTLSGAISAGSSSLSGTTSDTFEVNTDGSGAIISTTNRSTDGTYTLPNVAGAAQILTTNMSDAAVTVTLNAAANNGFSFDTDTLSIDAQSHKVGIGTTSPSERLTIDGGNSYSGYVETKSTNDNYSGILFRDADGVQWGLYKNATADPILQLGRYTDGVWQAAVMTFQRNGDVNFGDRYVGIGDTDPVASLVVGSDAGAAVSGAGDAYVQNDLEVDGTLYAAGSSLAGTTANTFTLNSDNTTDIATTLTFGGAGTGTGSVTTTVGNLTIAPNGGTTSVTGDVDVNGRIEIDSANAINNNGTTSVSVGALAGANNAGSGNTFMGASAGTAVNSGSDNTFIGNSAGAAATTAINSTFVGSNAGLGSNAGYNVFVGYYAGQNISGTGNVCVGQVSGYSSSSAASNTFIGSAAGRGNTTGDQNVYIGGNAGYANSTGSGNIFIGYQAGEDLNPVSNILVIDNTDTATPLIYGDFSTDTVTINGTLTATTVGFSSTTADAFEVNSDGNSISVSSAGQTADHVFTFPDATSAVLTSNMPADVAVTLGGGVDSLNFDSNTLSIDADNGRVGIGTAAPESDFEIYGSRDNSSVAMAVTNASAGVGYTQSEINVRNSLEANYASALRIIAFGTGYSTTGVYVADGSAISSDTELSGGLSIGTRHASAPLRFFTGGHTNERMRISEAGYTGVNTTDFDGTPAIGQLIVKGTTNDGSTNIQVWRDSDEANVAYLDTNGNLTLSGAISAGSSSFSGTTADTFTVNSDGTAAASTLALGAAGTTGGQITTGAGNLTIDSTGGTIDINDGVIDLSTQTVDVTLNAAADALNFDSNTLSIDASANRVGIGTPAPSSDLHIVTAATSGAGQYIDASSVTTGYGLQVEVDGTTMSTGYPMLITRDTVDMLHITESGGVVSENVFTSDTDSTGNIIFGEDADASIGYDGSDLVINPRVVGTGDMVLSSGNIGIGTAAPDYLLTIAPPLNVEASLGMISTSGAGAEIYFGYGGEYNAAIGYTQNFEGAIEFKTDGTNNASSKMILTSTGKVGIGTGTSTEPAAALDVQAAVTAASAVANGVRFQQTLTAAADNDSLSGLLINTTFADGGFSGVKHNGIAFPDAQGTKINVGYDAAKAKWIGIDGSWRQGFTNDTGFEFYISSNNTSWGDSKLHIDTDSVDFYVDPVVGTSGTNRWLKMFGNILFEENDDYIGTYNTGTFTVGNLQNTSTATTVNFGRDGGIDVMNFNRGGTTYNFLTLKSAGTDDITLDPAGNDVLPGSDSTDNLGSSGTRWLNGYFDNVYCANQNATNYVTGSDIAENVNSAKPLEPGTVVIIDPDNDSHIVPCKTANDTRVAGIISTKPAVWMGAKENKMGEIEEKEPGKEPLALAGRVPCKVDAGYGPIKRGDLLTTSPTEGHAMVARDPQIGAVVGKAMQSLESGKGTIEVLVVLR